MTGAEIIYGQRAATQFPTHKVQDGDELTVGKIKLAASDAEFIQVPQNPQVLDCR